MVSLAMITKTVGNDQSSKPPDGPLRRLAGRLRLAEGPAGRVLLAGSVDASHHSGIAQEMASISRHVGGSSEIALVASPCSVMRPQVGLVNLISIMPAGASI
jgi:hypothetical protein